ncbi:MAG TPA: 4,5-DOPA dioxygenase extradiol [Prolixibacteraceae bacterium]|nr:4,5-DOPA dioxygenase extradiol [Prolixibacteraceae bacterium]
MKELTKLTDSLIPSERMPLLFVGHGSPANAIEDNVFNRKWAEIGKQMPRPQAILCISAHWLTSGTFVTAMEKPRTIHDFSGFSDELFRQQYSVPGSPEMAEFVQQMQPKDLIRPNFDWGLDHGTWSVLKPMFPMADIPVFQLSIDYSKPPEFHFELARQLAKLREKGVMVIGSGNIVHNLRLLQFNEQIPEWASDFDTKIANWIETNDAQSVVNFQKMGSLAKMAHPSYDHFLPLIYALGFKSKDEFPEFFNTGFQLGSISMRSVIWK